MNELDYLSVETDTFVDDWFGQAFGRYPGELSEADYQAFYDACAARYDGINEAENRQLAMMNRWPTDSDGRLLTVSR